MKSADENYTHIEEWIEVKETTNIINDAINNLPSKRKMVYMLCKEEGKSHEDISQMLGISISTVNGHMVKSNLAIRKYLKTHLEITLFLIIVNLS